MPKAVQVNPNPYVPVRGHDIITFFGEKIIEGSEINIYNQAGEQIKKIKINYTNNSVKWNAKNYEGNKVASGIYIYTLETPAGSIYKGKLGIIR